MNKRQKLAHSCPLNMELLAQNMQESLTIFEAFAKYENCDNELLKTILTLDWYFQEGKWKPLWHCSASIGDGKPRILKESDIEFLQIKTRNELQGVGGKEVNPNRPYFSMEDIKKEAGKAGEQYEKIHEELTGYKEMRSVHLLKELLPRELNGLRSP